MTDATESIDDFELFTPDARADYTWSDVTADTPKHVILEGLLADTRTQVKAWKDSYERVEGLRQKSQKELRMYEKFFDILCAVCESR
jgi:hypothetical protein